MKNDVFISYSSKDRPFAQQLARALEQQGLGVWIDRDDIRAGIKWSSAIQEGLEQSSVVIIIITRDAMASKNVEDEWQYFLDKRKPIVPILHTPTDNIHFQLMRIQYVDFVNNSFEDAVKLLLYELKQHNVGAGVSETPTDVPSQSIAPPMRTAQNQSRNTTFAIVGAAVVIVLVMIGLFASRNAGSPVVPTNAVVREEVTSTLSPTEFAVVPTEVTAEPSAEAIAPTRSRSQTGVLLNIPYVSQFAPDAPFSNDDGPAALLMVLRWYAKTFPTSATASLINGLTVETVSKDAGMTSSSTFVLFYNLTLAAKKYALDNRFCRPISRERIFKELDNGRPVLILVNFKALRPELTYIGGHTVVVVGYDAENVIIYDPHDLDIAPEPKVIPVSYEFFESVIVNIPQQSLSTAQAIIFGKDNQC